MGLKGEIKNLFSESSTSCYPNKSIANYERFRGKISFDKSKCIGCAMCRMYCPAKCIKLVWKKKTMIVNKVEHQKIIHPIHEIDVGKCMRCGLCVDVCPVKCIWFTQEFELAEKKKEKIISETV